MEWRNRIKEIRTVTAAELQANPHNWRRHPERQATALRGLLAEVGIVAPLIAYESAGALRLIDGHMRQETGGQWPCVILDVSEEEAELILATFDPITGLATMDAQALAALLGRVQLQPIEDAGVKALLADLAQAAGVPAPQEAAGVEADLVDKAGELRAKWGVEPGQLWALGEQRLICGDCTDPPYLVDYDGKNHPHAWNQPDKNKDWSKTYHDWDQAAGGDGLYDAFVSVALEHAIQPNAAWYCWHASRRQALLESVWEEHGAFVHQQIIWAKDRPVLTRSWYMWKHEPCFFGWVRGKEPPRRAEDYPHSVWEIPTIAPGTETLHPTSKPIELFAIPIRQHTLAGEICYEPFAGSGSQIIACEQLGRRCRACEISPEYVAVALERWALLTQKEPAR